MISHPLQDEFGLSSHGATQAFGILLCTAGFIGIPTFLLGKSLLQKLGPSNTTVFVAFLLVISQVIVDVFFFQKKKEGRTIRRPILNKSGCVSTYCRFASSRMVWERTPANMTLALKSGATMFPKFLLASFLSG